MRGMTGVDSAADLTATCFTRAVVSAAARLTARSHGMDSPETTDAEL